MTKEIRILHLTLKKKWFDDILAGLKPEEYRDIKPHWVKRFINVDFAWDCIDAGKISKHFDACSNGFWKEYDIIRFTNGYSPDAPTFDIEFNGFRVGYGKPQWGAELGKLYFVLHLGNIIAVRKNKEV